MGSNHSSSTAASARGVPDSAAATGGSFDLDALSPPPSVNLGDDFDFGNAYHLPPNLLDDDVELIETQTRNLTLGEDLAALGLTSDPADPHHI